MIQNEQLTQVICEEEWEVSTGKNTFTLTPKQVALLKKATSAGKRGIVWFKDFAISIPHIVFIRLKRKEYFKLISDSVKQKISQKEYAQNVKSIEKKATNY